jgi:glycosyltransferase involved in cell wall biosynthesis
MPAVERETNPGRPPLGGPPRLTVLVVARNEERNLAGCLESAAFADERVVVVDPASTDGTLAIAQDLAEVVFTRPFDHFAAQRNAALARASGDWILSIDADERVTPALAGEIRARLAGRSANEVGFRVPIRSEILGRPFGHSGTQMDLPLRLFRRGRVRWQGRVHETVAIDGPIGRLTQALEHRTLPDVRVFLSKIEHYTSLEARELYQAGRRYRTSDLTLKPVWTFLRLYLYRQGFRDGVEGLMFCALSGVSVAIRTWKLRELGLTGRAT